MTKKISRLVLLLFITSSSVFCQIPHLEGKIMVSVKLGTIDADITLKNLPNTNNYTIWLNSGLNIEYFRDQNDQFNFSYNTTYNSDISSEALQYYFPSNDNKSRYLPTAFKVKYTGKFPVISDTTRAYDWEDWKGNIAFNAKTLRASEQSAWYPILYDIQNDLVIDKYSFNIEVECTDCQTLYLNGDEPKKTTIARFQSEQAVPLLIFVGNYEFKEINNIFILNSNLNINKLNTLTNTTNAIINFYERILKTPYGPPVVYLSSTPVSKKNEWMFVTYPTVAVIGIDKYKLDNYFDNETFQFKQKSNITFIAHELAHYYIGTMFVPNSKLKWLFLEGVTDYLSIKAAKEILGIETYNIIVTNYMNELQEFKPKPLNQIVNANQINETYRYRYTPLLLLAIENEIGEVKMYEWIKTLVNTKNQMTDYEFFIQSLSKVGIPEKQMNYLMENYINNPNSKENIFNTLK
tara:strand:- start:116168 stop:117559 length:1392 start_codon:yes stop_codon:yes gene_type:complete